jgi:RNA polymerase-interacting CarD/CdnL/TRCF family regulator
MTSAFKTGELVIFPGQGVVVIEAPETREGESFIPLTAETARIGVPAKNLARAVRRPMSAEQAKALLTRLEDPSGAPDTRSWELRYRDLSRSLVRGTPEQQAQALHTLYLSPYRHSFGERRLIMSLENALLGEIALARSGAKTLAEVIAARDEQATSLHAAFASFAPAAAQRPPEAPLEPPRPADPFSIPDTTYLGSFSVGSGRIAAGDPVLIGSKVPGAKDRQAFVLQPAWNGLWHAYVRSVDGRPSTLFAFVDPSVVKGGPAAPGIEALGRVWVDSGKMAILDEAKRAAPEVEDEMSFPLFDETLVLGSGCMSTSGEGDGTYPVLASMDQGKVTWVAVDFEDESDAGKNPSWQFLQDAQRKIRLGK